MRLLPATNAVKELTINDGKVIKRDKDATFHMDSRTGKALAKSGEWTIVGTNLRSAQGYVCQDCGFVAVFKKCGKCGSTDMVAE